MAAARPLIFALAACLGGGVPAVAAELAPEARAEPTPDRIDIRIDGARVSAEIANAPLGEALATLARRSGFELVVEGGVEGTVSLSRRDAGISEVLDELLRTCSWFSVYAPGGAEGEERLSQVWILPSPRCVVGPGEVASAPEVATGVTPGAAGADRDHLAEQQQRLARVINGAEPADLKELVATSRDARDPSLRILSLIALGRSRAPEARSVLLDALTDPNAAIRQIAVRGLAQAWPDAAVEPLSDLLTTESDIPTLREAAMRLAMIGTDKAREGLRLAATLSDVPASRIIRETIDRFEARASSR